MNMKDYYAELGVAPDADDQVIKQAYRQLARQYHPDVNPGDKQAEERFKAINEAYQTLGDPQKRRQYDAFRQQYQQWQQSGRQPGFDGGYWQAGPGTHVYTTGHFDPQDFADLFGSNSPFGDIFGSIFGRAGYDGDVRPAPGRDLEVPVEISLEEAFHGTTRSLQLGDQHIEARIPRGVNTGSRVRLANQGRLNGIGGMTGDIYLRIQVQPHPRFEREGHNLRTDVPVDIYTAAVGGEARVTTLDGTVLLKIPPRTQADKVFRLRGKGMPRLDRPDERGDLYARVKLVLPDVLSDSELATLRELARKHQKVEYVQSRATA